MKKLKLETTPVNEIPDRHLIADHLAPGFTCGTRVLGRWNYRSYIMKYTVIFFLFTVLFSCKSNTDNHPEVVVRDTVYLDSKGKQYKGMGAIPDSLRTPEQRKLIRLLNEVIVNNISAKNNHMVFGLTKEQFVAKGIPERYYDQLQQNIRDNNTFFDANGITNVNKMVEESRKEYYEKDNQGRENP